MPKAIPSGPRWRTPVVLAAVAAVVAALPAIDPATAFAVVNSVAEVLPW